MNHTPEQLTMWIVEIINRNRNPQFLQHLLTTAIAMEHLLCGKQRKGGDSA